MAYVDYKCLESLLIEGEDLQIANEGFFGSIISKLISALSVISKLIDKLINAIKSKFKKSNKETPVTTTSPPSINTAKSRDYSIKEISDDESKEMADKMSNAVRNSDGYKRLISSQNTDGKPNSVSAEPKPKAKKSINIYMFIMEISKIERLLFDVSVNKNYMEDAMDKDDREIYGKNMKISDAYNQIKEMAESLDEKLNTCLNDCDSYYIPYYNETKESILSKLSDLKSSIDKHTEKYTQMYNMFKRDPAGNSVYNNKRVKEMTPTINLINKISSLITKLTTIVNNCEPRYEKV